MATSGTSATAPKERTSPTPSSEGPMTHTLQGREAPQAAAIDAIRCSPGAPEAVHLRRVGTNGDRPSGHETGPTPSGPLRLIPYAYRGLLREPNSQALRSP